MIEKYFDELKFMATVRHHPMEKKLHDIYIEFLFKIKRSIL